MKYGDTNMTAAKKILLLGFTPFEKSTFESFFKLVGRRETVYQVVPDVSQAMVLLVNGDNPTAVELASASVKAPQKALYIGKPDPAGIWPTSTRPIRLTTVLGLLDALVSTDTANAIKSVSEQAQSTTATLSPPAAMQPQVSQAEAAVISHTKTISPSDAFGSLPKNTLRQGSGAGHSRSVSSFGSSAFMGLGKAPEPANAAQQFDDILVVDDSDVALKFMQNRLTRYGFRSELAKSGEEALHKIASETYKFVFLDVMMEGLDGYQTCRAIKQKKYSSGKTPVVVMLTSRGGSIDKIRGGLAGCDAYLTKPLNEAELLKVLSKHDAQVERSFRETNFGGSGMSSASPS